MEKLRKFCGISLGIPTPKFLLKMGASMINTDAELVLKSRWVVPEILLKKGFHFNYPTVDKALEDVVKD